jgi:hypothetical protein
MDVVFIWAGTYSLERELTPKPVAELAAGDLFIKGGFPGHAVLVADAVENRATGERRFLLVQSFMPAQEMHVLKNPADATARPGIPWLGDRLVTPGGCFPREPAHLAVIMGPQDNAIGDDRRIVTAGDHGPKMPVRS